MNRFPENDIISLVGTPPRYDLGESTGPDLRLADLLDEPGHKARKRLVAMRRLVMRLHLYCLKNLISVSVI